MTFTNAPLIPYRNALSTSFTATRLSRRNALSVKTSHRTVDFGRPGNHLLSSAANADLPSQRPAALAAAVRDQGQPQGRKAVR